MYKVAFLFDKRNNWIKKFINKNIFQKNKKYKYNFVDNINKLKNYDLTFILGYTKIIKLKNLKKNKLNLVVHESDLPKGKGFAPVQNQILLGKNKIPICLFQANERVDSGRIFKKEFFNVKETSLYNQIRNDQGNATMKIIKKFLKEYPNIKSKKQTGKSTFFKKRNKLSSEINILKSIKSQFNLLRIVNNEKWPAFFKYKGKKFYLKIYK